MTKKTIIPHGSQAMLLCIDIGNTNIVLGLSDGERILHHWRMRTERAMTCDEMGVMVQSFFTSAGAQTNSVGSIIVVSVVPPLMNAVEQFCRRYFKLPPLVVGPETTTGMPILYDDPKEVGPDRIVNSVAAYEKYRKGLVVIDFGTATTFDCVSKEGAFLGGAISPGVLTSCEALFQNTSRLPRVEVFTKPVTAIAKSTIGSINVGIVYGYAGLVDGIVKRIRNELGQDLTVIATGGLAPLMCGVAESIDHVEEFLTLEGLMIISRRNR